MTSSLHRPIISISEISPIALELYSWTAQAHELESYCDRNYLLEGINGNRSILKIANASEQKANLALQNSMMQHLELHTDEAIFPTVIRSKNNRGIETVTLRSGQIHLIRLISYLPGKPLATINNQSPKLLHSLGSVLGRMDQALVDFDNEKPDNPLGWDLRQAETMVTGGLRYVAEPSDQALIEHFFGLYRKDTAEKIDCLRQSFIHNDANDYNILVSPIETTDQNATEWDISGLIDFGDLVYSQTINNLAICVAYMMMDKADPIAAVSNIIKGYNSQFPLKAQELEHLFLLACMRLCVSVAMGAKQRDAEPENEYVSITERPALAALRKLELIPINYATDQFVLACR